LEAKIDEEIKINEKPAEKREHRVAVVTKLAEAMKKGRNKNMKKKARQQLSSEKSNLKVDDEMLYELPIGTEGKIISIHDSLRYVLPEVLFCPQSILGNHNTELGLSDLIFRSIKMCDVGLEKMLVQNIVLAGEITELPGFTARLKTEMENAYKVISTEFDEIVVRSDLRRRDGAWRGGSMFASLPTFATNIRFSREKFFQDEKIALKQYF